MEVYAARGRNDAMAAVVTEDRPALMAAIQHSLRTGEPMDLYYRVFHKSIGIDWALVNARFCGTMEGDPRVSRHLCQCLS